MDITPDIEALARLVAEKWGEKTIAEFAKEAEATGTKYEAIRTNGVLVLLLISIAAPDQLAVLERAFSFADDGSPQEPALTLAEAVRRTISGGFAYERVGSSLVLISTEPRSKQMLCALFGIPA